MMRHVLAVTVMLMLTAGLPGLYYLNRNGYFTEGADAVSSASMVVPDQPSGSYLVLINRRAHAQTLAEWEAFFREEPVGVIMEDIRCLCIQGDVLGQQLAVRYLARLAENQMILRREEGTLLVSKAEQGLFDVIILSQEAADLYGYDLACAREDVQALSIQTEEGEGK